MIIGVVGQCRDVLKISDINEVLLGLLYHSFGTGLRAFGGHEIYPYVKLV